MSAEVEHRLHTLLSKVTGEARPADFDPDGSVLEQYRMDSMAAVEFTVVLDQEFGIAFGSEMEDLDALDSFTELAALVNRRRST